MTTETATEMSRRNLVGLGREALAAEMAAFGAEPFRARQLWHWIYHRGAADFAAMTSLSKAFRDRLAEHYELRRPDVSQSLASVDGTRKWLLRFADGQEVETVHIPEEDRGTLCVSSQVGCTLNCTFCHTGTQLLVRNLGPAEIVGQVMVARDALGEWRRRRRIKRGRPPAHQHRADGDGRAALQFRQRRGGDEDRHGPRGPVDLAAQDHAVDRRRRADDPALRRRARGQPRDLAACGARRHPRPAGAAQPEIPDRRIARRLPQLSRRPATRAGSPSNTSC